MNAEQDDKALRNELTAAVQNIYWPRLRHTHAVCLVIHPLTKWRQWRHADDVTYSKRLDPAISTTTVWPDHTQWLSVWRHRHLLL